jgi:general secretion pathway protein A
MYLDFYQLTLKPFQITSDPKFLWLGEKHKEALATLRYGIVDNRGFLLLTGEVGTGKTILINRLTTLLDIDTVVATLPDPDLDSMDFYNLLADGLQMNRTFHSKGAFLIHLRDFLHQSHSDGKQVLLIIDESQRLNHKLMEDIRVLSNIELHDRKLINIFFVGQQEFNNILMTPQNRALAQRITVRYHIEPLNRQETGDYVTHRLKIAGRAKPIFNTAALTEIYTFSGGIPRLINIISDHALLTGYSRSVKRIDASIIKECAAELRIPIQQPDPKAATLKPGIGKIPDDSAASHQKIQDVLPPQGASESPWIWKLGYVILVMGLIAAVTYVITQFSARETNQYDVADLTPQKYKTTLDREKAMLADHLEHQAVVVKQQPPAVQERSDEILPDLSQTADATGAVTEGSVHPVEKVVETTQHMNAEKMREPDDRQTGVPEIPDTATVSKIEPARRSVADPAAGQGADTGSETNRHKIESLPLKDEKIIIPFGINSNEIDARSYALLDQVAAYLARHPGKFAYLRGYTDSSGSDGYNESVSRFRASAIKSYLIGKGAYPEKIEVIAMADQNPIAPNDTAEGRIKNRRVEIEFADNTITDR